MSRNRYTKLVRKSERSQIVRQEKELTVIRRKLRQDAKPTAGRSQPVVAIELARRSVKTSAGVR